MTTTTTLSERFTAVIERGVTAGEWKNLEVEANGWLLSTAEKQKDGPVRRLSRDRRRYGCDSSGEVVEDYDTEGEEPLTVGDVLNYYTGEWEPTFMSGYGKNWLTYRDEFDRCCIEALHELIWSACRRAGIDLDDEATRDELDSELDEVTQELRYSPPDTLPLAELAAQAERCGQRHHPELYLRYKEEA
jgi:hypothetical protein